MNSDQIFDQLEKVAKAGGHSKKALVNDFMREYFVAAYDPFTMYFNTVSPKGHGTEFFSDKTWALLNSLSNRAITGDQAKLMINVHVSELTPKSAELFNRILNKDLRIGMRAKTINQIFPGLIPTHDVMLAKLFDPKKVKFPCYAGVKIDGIRGTYKWKKKKFYTRNGHEILGLEHMILQLDHTEADLDGELFIPDLTFQQSSGNIRSDSPSPNAVFAMFEVPGTNMSFLDRLKYMEAVSKTRSNILRLKHYKIYDIDELYRFYHWARSKGHEGAVIRPMDYEYAGTRSYSWMKMKNIMDFDLKIVDMYEGKGKYKGQMGGVKVEFNGQQAVGGGWSDYERKNYWDHPEKIMGKILHVTVTEFTDDKNFRHARKGKEGIRWDK